MLDVASAAAVIARTEGVTASFLRSCCAGPPCMPPKMPQARAPAERQTAAMQKAGH